MVPGIVFVMRHALGMGTAIVLVPTVVPIVIGLPRIFYLMVFGGIVFPAIVVFPAVAIFPTVVVLPTITVFPAVFILAFGIGGVLFCFLFFGVVGLSCVVFPTFAIFPILGFLVFVGDMILGVVFAIILADVFIVPGFGAVVGLQIFWAFIFLGLILFLIVHRLLFRGGIVSFGLLFGVVLLLLFLGFIILLRFALLVLCVVGIGVGGIVFRICR